MKKYNKPKLKLLDTPDRSFIEIGKQLFETYKQLWLRL